MKTSILAITMSSLILLGGCTGLPGGFLFGPVDHLTVTPGDDFELAETSKGDQEQLIQENVCNAFNFLDPVYFAGLSPAPPVAACTQSLNNETDTVPEHLLSANPNFFSTLYTALVC